MKTPEEILKDQRLNISEFVRTGCLKAMEEYAVQSVDCACANAMLQMETLEAENRSHIDCINGQEYKIMELEQQNTLLAQKCSDYADQLTKQEAQYDLQVRKNIQDIEAGNKIMEDYKAAQDKLLYISQVVKKNEEYIKVLETKIQFLEPYKDLYEEYKARYEFEENPPEVEEIFVTSSCPEDVYAAFIDKDRAQWDAKESGTELCSIKLYRGPKAIFNDNEKDY